MAHFALPWELFGSYFSFQLPTGKNSSQMTQHRTALITKTLVDAMRVGDILHDTAFAGFGARRQAKAVSFFFKGRLGGGKQRWVTIGQYGRPWTVDSARKEAIRFVGTPPPTKEEKAEQVAKQKQETPLSFAEVAETFLATHGTKLKPRTLVQYRRLMRDKLLPAFEGLALNEITRTVVDGAHSGWNVTPRDANHALSVLSKLMNWAEDQGYRVDGSNPCRRVVQFKTEPKERFLTKEELERLGSVLVKVEREQSVGLFALAAIRLLILTGARLSEILTLEWSFVDYERRALLLPDSKTGKKSIPLNDAAILILKAIPKYQGNSYVIVGNRHGKHLVNLHKPWIAIRAEAGLEDVRLHDLRHTYASVAVASGGSLPMIGKMLGHSQTQTTERYAHLTDDPVQKLAQSTGEVLATALLGKQ